MSRVNVLDCSKAMLWQAYENEGVTLAEMIDEHEDLGMLIPGVECPCDSLPGEPDDHLFIAGFLAILHFHVAAGQIEGMLEEAAKDPWDLWRANHLKRARLRRSSTSDSIILPAQYGLIAGVPLSLPVEVFRKMENNEPLSHVEFIHRAGLRERRWEIVSTITTLTLEESDDIAE